MGGWGQSASGARQLSAQAAGRYLQGLEPSTASTAGEEPMDYFDEDTSMRAQAIAWFPATR